MSEPAIRAEGLSVRFRAGFGKTGVEALAGVSLAVAAGEIVGVLGPNGSGKTTLLSVLAGMRAPSAGTATVLGKSPTDRALLRTVGWQPDAPLPLRELTPRDLLVHLACTQGLSAHDARAAAVRWMERLAVAHAADRRVRTLSTGTARRIALCAALLTDPRVLLLDEPTATLDPEGSLLVLEILKELAQRGVAVLLASHDLQEVEQICARVLLLDAGRVRAEGSLDDLLGAGDPTLVVRGLDERGLAAVEASVRAAGGTVVGRARAREHLFALFRRLRDGGR